MAEKKLLSVREHADALIATMQNGTTAPDAATAARTAEAPAFTAGTATLDGAGKPVAPGAHADAPPFTAGVVAVPVEQQSAAPLGTPAPATAPTARADDAPAVAPSQPPGATAGASAAEAAATAVVDAFAEYDEFEFEDPNIGVKIPLRVPRQYADSAKRGYGLRSMYDRTVSRYKNADPVLAHLIESGQISAILPLIQEAINDPQGYGEYVFQGYERKRKGQPLIEQARQEAAAAAVVEPSVGEFALSDDPFFDERVRPLATQLQSVTQTLEQMRTAAAQREQQEADFQRQQEWRGQQMALAHQDLAMRYPGNYTGDLGRDQAVWNRTVQYAKEAGYVDAYGPRAALVLAGDVIYRLEQERLAATASPAATALQQAENQHLDLARQQAAAASRVVGGGSPTPAPAPTRLPPPTTRNPDGTIKSPAQYLQEQQAYHAAGAPA